MLMLCSIHNNWPFVLESFGVKPSDQAPEGLWYSPMQEVTDHNGNTGCEPTISADQHPPSRSDSSNISSISVRSSQRSTSKRSQANWRVIPSGFVRPIRAMNGKKRPTQKISTTSLDPRTLVESAQLLGSIGSLHAAHATEKLRNGGRAAPEEDMYSEFDFPFENLVFEGGGNKGMAYVGVLQVLENAGAMKKIKRIAGASAGAIIATLIALDYDSQDLKEFLEQDLRRILVDHSCGYCSLLPNLLKGFGWNPGRKLMRWFGEQLKERTGDGDVTFREVHERFGKELCIVVTNLNQMSVEYFHPKTTPNMPVRRAVRMSIALPGVFQCVREVNNDYEDVYVDGGLLCNYPIHAFDGWWLSMDPKDTFFKRLQPLEDFARLFEKSERFGKWNDKTLGIVLFSHTETELMKTLLTERTGNRPPRKPNTKLARQRNKIQLKQIDMRDEHATMVGAVGRFMKELQRNNLDEDSIINLKELRGVFKKPIDFTRKDAELLFGEGVDYRSAFEELDTDEDGEITFQELMAFIEKKGVNLQTRFLGYARKEINHLGDFIQTLQTALSVNVKRVYVEKKDVHRTVGIDTDYIETNDFYLEPGDVQFLIESGRRATRAFLREYAMKNQQAPPSIPEVPIDEPVQAKSASTRPRNQSIVSAMSNSSVSSLGEPTTRTRLKTPNTLPPIGQASPPQNRKTPSSAESGDSVRSMKKISVDMPRSPASAKRGGRSAKVGHMTPV